MQKTCEGISPLTNESEEKMSNRCLLTCLYQQPVVFATPGAAEGPRAPAEANPRHLPEVRPAPGEGGAV